MVISEFLKINDLSHTQWGVLQYGRAASNGKSYPVRIPREADYLATWSQHLVENFRNSSDVILNVDNTKPLYPHNEVVINEIMRMCGDFEEINFSKLTHLKLINDNYILLSLFSHAIISLVVCDSSFQIWGNNNIIYINDYNIINSYESVKYQDINDEYLKNATPPSWVLDFLSQNQS